MTGLGWDEKLEHERVHREAVELIRPHLKFLELARQHVQRKEWDEAAADFTKVVSLRPDDPQYWFERGQVYVQLRDWKSAAADFARALTLLPEDDPASGPMAEAYVAAAAKADPKQGVRALLKNADPRIRFQAAVASIPSGDKAAIEVVIALLGEGPVGIAYQAESLLYQLAGDTAAAGANTNSASARLKSRGLWAKWWQANAASLDLTKINLEKTLLGLTVICEYDGGGDGQGRVWVCRADGQMRQEIRGGLGGALDAHLLPNGNFLIAEYATGRRVTERTRDNKVVWQYQANNTVRCCQRLSNGNTVLATDSEVLEVDRAGKAVFRLAKPDIHYATRLANGHTVFVSGNQIVELDAAGKELRSTGVTNMGYGSSVDRLANGNYLVADHGGSQAIEVDVKGKVVWAMKVPAPSMALRLPNGNTLVASTTGRFVAEYDRAGREVWKTPAQGDVWRVRRY